MQATAYLRNAGIVDGTSVSILEYYKTHMSPYNTSGHTGVYWDKKNEKWIAQIGFKGKIYYLGSYNKFHDAVAAREQGEKMHDEFLEWYYRENPPKKRKKQESNETSISVLPVMMLEKQAAE